MSPPIPTSASAAPSARPSPEVPERVLLVAGGGDATAAAVRWIARRATTRGVALTLAAVADGAPPDALIRTESLLRTRFPELDARTLRVGGDPVDALVAASKDADLVVTGSNRVTPLSRALPPTRTVRLTERMHRPVVLVPRGWMPGEGPVLAGASGDPSDVAALQFAASEATALGRPLQLVHVWRLSAVVTPVFGRALDSSPVRAAHAVRLAAECAQLQREHPGLEVSTRLVHGEPSLDVARLAREAELVVVGSHGWGRIDRVLLRSVGRALAERPPCVVAVVPPQRASRIVDAERGH